MSSMFFAAEAGASESAAEAAASASAASSSETAAAASEAAAESHKDAAAVSAGQVAAANSVAGRFEPQTAAYLADIDQATETGLFLVGSGQTANAPANPLGGSYGNAVLFVESVTGKISQTLALDEGVRMRRVSTDGTATGWTKWREIETWRRKAWMKQKHLVSADWQPKPEAMSPGEAATLQGYMDTIAARHPDLTHAHLMGDAVHEADLQTTGAAPEYGFPELLSDISVRLPVSLHNVFFLIGNHDRNNTTVGDFKGAWSTQTFRSFLGPEYYYTLQGNLMFVYLGDMGGTTGGAITDAVVAWFRSLVFRNKDKNIILCLHQPLSGTYQGKTEATDQNAVQSGSARITSILDDVAADAANIPLVLYGHVGNSNQFNDEVHHGARHIQIGMHLPDGGSEYYVMELVHGAASIDIVQWDAATDTEGATKTVNLPYTLQLGPEIVRRMDGPTIEPVKVAVPLDEYVEDTGGGNFAVPEGTKVSLGDFRFEDRANLANPNNLEAGFWFGWGIVNTGGDHDGAASSPAHEKAAFAGLARINGAGSGTAPTLTWHFETMKDGVLKDAFWADTHGVHVGHNGNATSNPAAAGSVGATLHQEGYGSFYDPDGPAIYAGRDGVGNLANFYDVNGYIGGIENDAGTVALTQASDYRLKVLKDAPGGHDPEGDVKALGGLVKFYEYKNYPGVLKMGWLAHEMAAITPDAVTGEKDAEDADGNPIYQQRKDPNLIPLLTQALARALVRLDQAEAEIQALKGAA